MFSNINQRVKREERRGEARNRKYCKNIISKNGYKVIKFMSKTTMLRTSKKYKRNTERERDLEGEENK